MSTVYEDSISTNGAVAQLGERMTGSHEVRGSIPLGSTNHFNELKRMVETGAVRAEGIVITRVVKARTVPGARRD